MAVYKPDLVKKILRMAESEHDGEAAAAMRKLTAMAKEQGHNLDEMMAHVYGNGNGASKPFGRPSGRYRDPFEEMFRQARQAEEKAAEARRKREAEANEAKKRAERPTPRWYHEPDPPPEPPPWDEPNAKFSEPCLQDLYDAYHKFGVAPLSVWEVNFVTDILSRGKDYSTSPAQDAVIDRIVSKYAGWEHRNGSAEGFWKS